MTTWTPAFLQSLIIITREGLEVVLILGAVLAVLGKVSPDRGKAPLWWGAALGFGASLVTAAVVEIVFHSSEHLELLEGLTLALAAGVLLFVGHWLLAKTDVARWKAYLAARVKRGAGRGSAVALGLVAFLAVYREGVETVLFYRALLSTEEAKTAAVLAGFVAGVVALGVIIYAIGRVGLRVPLRPFFATTSAFLMLMAFVFAGKAVHELQEAGLVSENGLRLPRLPEVGLYPTLETTVAQVLMACAIVVPALLRRAHLEPPPPESERSAAQDRPLSGLQTVTPTPETGTRPMATPAG
jgi:high-affinity iron transporter